jgi:D-alanyl-D-alanine carboxypeptidase
MPVGGRFRIASVSKTFLATVVLQLVGEGRLRLDDPVGHLLPGRSVGLGRVTVRQLLSHTSGIYPGGPLTAVPGPFRYDNGNFVLLGEIVEAVTRASLQDVYAERLLRPLRLTGTMWPVTSRPPRLARGYSPSGTDVTALPPRSLDAADALVSTADDLRRFITALLRGRLIAPAQLAAMETSVPVGKAYRPIDDRYGLGLMRYDTPCGPAWGHRGRIDGYTSFVFGSPSGRRSVVVLLNVGRVSDSVVVRLNRLVFGALCA